MRKEWVINGWSIYVQVVELLLNFNRSFYQELVVLHTILFMFGDVLVHVWSQRGCCILVTFYIGSLRVIFNLFMNESNSYQNAFDPQ